MDTSRHVPTRISPNYIRDAIVIVEFETDYNQTKIENLVVNKLNEFEGIPFQQYEIKKQDVDKIGKEITVVGNMYANNLYKVQVEPDRIIFNIVDAYPGWHTYSEFIMHILNSIGEAIMMRHVSMRYIDVLTNESIMDNLDGTVRFEQFEELFYGTTLSFSCRAANQGNNTDMSVNVRLIEKTLESHGHDSIVDIIVEYEPKNQNNEPLNYQHKLDQCHLVQKDAFFRLMKEEFVNRHHPEYDNE